MGVRNQVELARAIIHSEYQLPRDSKFKPADILEKDEMHTKQKPISQTVRGVQNFLLEKLVQSKKKLDKLEKLRNVFRKTNISVDNLTDDPPEDQGIPTPEDKETPWDEFLSEDTEMSIRLKEYSMVGGRIFKDPKRTTQ